MSSSRIIVKNLPKYVNEDRVKKHFSAKGQITDVKLIKTRDGIFRRFAFVGFKSEEQAGETASYFNGTFFDTCKLEVQLAKGVGDDSLPRPWSKYSKKQSVEIQVKEPKLIETAVPSKVDAKLEEFLHVMKPKKSDKTWTNDDIGVGVSTPTPSSLDPATENEQVDSTIAIDQTVSDLDYLKSKIERVQSGNEPAVISTATDTILDTGRLFVRNLGYDVTEDDIQEHFGKFGSLAEVHLSIDKKTKKSKGFAYVLYMFPENALKAYESLDGSIFHGRLIHVIAAQDKPDKLRADNEDSAPSSAYKKKKQEALKKSSNSDFNWNSLFMNTDAVVGAMAEKLDVGKSDIMDFGAENLAVRVALAETHVIGDAKDYLKSNGISLDFIQDSSSHGASLERSKTVILVKNIPFDTTDLEVRNLFQKFGALGRVLIPPTKTIAIVEFLEASEARSAFRNLAYTRFKSLPLFLEWAPERLFEKTHQQMLQEKATNSEAVKIDPESMVDTTSVSNPNTVYVKNLNFSTTEETLRSLIEEKGIGEVRSITIAKKKDLKAGGALKSIGYGFVEFKSKEDAIRFISILQGFELEGHVLKLKLSSSVDSSASSNKNSTTATDAASRISKKRAPNASCTKLLVKNIPFESNEREIRELFKSFGQVKSVRLPKKINGQHRGFGFVDFITHEDAEKCIKDLTHTHFYGRHLVLDWAEDDDSVEALREKEMKLWNKKENGSIKSGKRERIEFLN